MNERTSTARVALKWGGVLGIALILFSLILYLTDNTSNAALGAVTYLFMAVGIVLAMREYRTLNSGYMTYGEGLGLGALTATISGLLSSLFSVFYTTVIDTGIMERASDKIREQLEDRGVPDEQIDQQMEMMQMFQSPGLLFVFGVIGSAFIGLLLSLVIAAFMRRNNPNPFD
ncbi:DUF4199 domain-containing protein [Spirosoma soli]|uniref:DUF4199 domain-containing protein n=1 Tax=Spirosoma soli TaxID=1770529 RepID=A0ABW5M4N8_9BACT